MDDMSAFERHIANEVRSGAGPSEPVDDFAVFEPVTAATKSLRWGFTVFSALELIAGVGWRFFGVHRFVDGAWHEEEGNQWGAFDRADAQDGWVPVDFRHPQWGEPHIAADGSVWILASKSDARFPLAHLYVITAEAVATAE